MTSNAMLFQIRSNDQGCTNPRHHVAVETKFCTVVPNMCGSSVWSLLHVTLLMPGILRLFLDFWKICVALPMTIAKVHI